MLSVEFIEKALLALGSGITILASVVGRMMLIAYKDSKQERKELKQERKKILASIDYSTKKTHSKMTNTDLTVQNIDANVEQILKSINRNK